jgi:hypothetical protein
VKGGGHKPNLLDLLDRFETSSTRGPTDYAFFILSSEDRSRNNVAVLIISKRWIK